MNSIAHLILPYLLLYKYWALFSVTFIAALILPIPPGTLIMGAAAMSYDGYFSFVWVLVAAIAGNIAGDNVGYFIARQYGRTFLQRVGFRKTLSSPRYFKLAERLRTKPGFIIFISRFEVFANLSVNIMCGLSKVPYTKYLMYEVIGEVVQVALYATLGYLFAPSWQLVNAIVGRSLTVILLILALLFVIYRRKILRWFK